MSFHLPAKAQRGNQYPALSAGSFISKTMETDPTGFRSGKSPHLSTKKTAVPKTPVLRYHR
jgi:hypothetical protein